MPGFDPVEAKFIALDVDQWVRDHRIANDAEARGEEDLPPSDARSLGDQETKIVAWINSRALDCHGQVTDYLTDLRADLVDIVDDAGLNVLVQKAEETRNAATIELAHQVERDRGDLYARGADLQLADNELADFRERQGLRRPADYAHRLRAGLTILLCFVVETALNATLLMDVNAFGLVGSITQMGLISAVNILIAALAMGAVTRRAHYRSPWWKIVAWIGMAAILAFVLAFNLAIGHFRDSMQAVLSDPSADILALGNDALVRLADGPFLLQSFQSALLALLGLLFFALASWKWLQRDDPYPGYGTRARQLAESRGHYDHAFRDALARLQQTYTERDAQLQDIRHRLELREARWEEIGLQGGQVRKAYRLHMKQYQLDLNHLLSLWRTVNRDHRSTPPPAYFDTEEPIDQDLLSAPDFEPPERASLASVTDTVHAAIRDLQKTYADRAAEYPSLGAMLHRRETSAG